MISILLERKKKEKDRIIAEKKTEKQKREEKLLNKELGNEIDA